MEQIPHLVKVDRVKLLSSNTMEQSTLFVQVYNLERLDFLCKFTSSNICVDIQNLAFLTFRKTAQNRQGTRTDGCLDRTFVYLGDLANKSVFLAVEVVRGEDA